LEFLKMKTRRETRYRDRAFSAIPSSRDNLLPSLKWITRTLPSDIALVVNANNMLRLSFGWEREMWEAFRTELYATIHSVGIHQFDLLDYNTLLQTDCLLKEVGFEMLLVDAQPVRRDAVFYTRGCVDFARIIPVAPKKGEVRKLTPGRKSGVVANLTKRHRLQG